MSDAKKMSRRDWFRLARRAKTDGANPSADNSMGDRADGLEPIERPVNHDGMDLSQLPPLREASLTADQVNQLFADIQELASDILLMQRSTRSPRATASRATTVEQLHSAREAILNGTIPRLQIRYRWEAANWIDTLQSNGEEFRLVRIQHVVPDHHPTNHD